MFIDLHILQTVPYSNLNRDDVGTPKSVVYGGATRARVSSQAWKRATRVYLERRLDDARTFRTRHPHQRLAGLLEEKGLAVEEGARVARYVFSVLGTDTSSNEDSVILFIAESELVALRDVVLANAATLISESEAKKKGKQKKAESAVAKELEACLTVARPTTVALFGRMLASAPTVNVDAAMQVAHAFSVHPVEVELDYFTAAEDLPEETDLTGGAHIGTAEFVAATLYRYATLNTEELTTNIGGDRQIAANLACLSMEAFALSLPTGKSNVTAPHTVPELVAASVRKDRPVSLAGAFEQPITQLGSSGYSNRAVERLSQNSQRVAAMLPEDASYQGHVFLGGHPPLGLGDQVESLTKLIETSVATAFGDRP